MPFFSYNTDDSTTGQAPLAGNGTTTIGPLLTGVASKVAGSCFSDQAGTLKVQQSFDYLTSGGTVNPSPSWDVTQSYTITANTPQTIDIDVVAPFLQVVYTNGATPQGHLRIFIRVFGVNRG